MLPNMDGARAERAPFLLGKRGVGRWPVQNDHRSTGTFR